MDALAWSNNDCACLSLIILAFTSFCILHLFPCLNTAFVFRLLCIEFQLFSIGFRLSGLLLIWPNPSKPAILDMCRVCSAPVILSLLWFFRFLKVLLKAHTASIHVALFLWTLNSTKGRTTGYWLYYLGQIISAFSELVSSGTWE